MKKIDFLTHHCSVKALACAVINQCGGWFCFTEIAPDVDRHGASGGFSGFIYYTETTAFYDKNKKAILESLAAMAADMGTSIIEMVAGFNCVNSTLDEIARVMYGSGDNDDDGIKNALSWYALETVAMEFDNANNK